MATRSGALGTSIAGNLSAATISRQVASARLVGAGSLAALTTLDRQSIVLQLNSQTPNGVLSNADLTISIAGSPDIDDYESVFSSVYRSNAKLYYEATIGAAVFSEDIGIGVANSGANGGQFAGENGNSIGVFNGSGNVYYNNAGTGVTITSYTAGDTVCVAVDLINALIWFRRIRSLAPSNWNNPSPLADPATGVGGINISALGTRVRAMITQFSPGENVTVNFGATSFLGTMPHGFIPFVGIGDAPASPVATSNALLGSVGRYAIGQQTPNNFPLFIAGGYGEANMIGTTEWIALVESMRAKMGFAARMQVTKL